MLGVLRQLSAYTLLACSIQVIFPKYVDEMAISELKRVERERAAAVSEGRIQKFSRRPGDRAFSVSIFRQLHLYMSGSQ